MLAGTADNFMPLSVAEEMHKKLKCAMLKIFPTDHITAIEAPKDFNEEASLHYEETRACQSEVADTALAALSKEGKAGKPARVRAFMASPALAA